MRLPRWFRRSQFRSDLLGQQTGGYQGEDFAFAGSQRALEFFDLEPPELFSAPFARKSSAATNRVQQSLIVNRLFEKVHGALPHRVHSEREIAMPGHENDRSVGNGAVEFLFKLTPVPSVPLNVRHHTIEVLRIT